jgi:hypothetical protein
MVIFLQEQKGIVLNWPKRDSMIYVPIIISHNVKDAPNKKDIRVDQSIR